MNGWIIAIGLALAVLAAAILILRLPRKGWEVVAAALVLGLAGYALQGTPGEAGSPREPAEKQGGDNPKSDEKLNEKPVSSDPWVVTANALYRHGQYADAANYLRGALRTNPGNAEAWMVTANSLVAHAEGNLSPAALYAFQQAQAAAPDHPGPQFFLGMALAQSGKLVEGRAVWAQLLARSPADAPWRADLEQQIARLDAFIASQRETPGG